MREKFVQSARADKFSMKFHLNSCIYSRFVPGVQSDLPRWLVTPRYRPFINGRRDCIRTHLYLYVSLPCTQSTMRELFTRCLPVMAVITIVVCSISNCSADAVLIGGPISDSLRATLPSTLILCISDAVSLDDDNIIYLK